MMWNMWSASKHSRVHGQIVPAQATNRPGRVQVSTTPDVGAHAHRLASSGPYGEATKRIRTCKVLTSTCAIALAVLPVAGCSSSRKGQAPQDASQDASPDCVQMQQAYVNGRLAPNAQSDVASTVHAVVGAADFPQAMPYCSGALPGSH